MLVFLLDAYVRAASVHGVRTACRASCGVDLTPLAPSHALE